jgi:hypothetical protein
LLGPALHCVFQELHTSYRRIEEAQKRVSTIDTNRAELEEKAKLKQQVAVH